MRKSIWAMKLSFPEKKYSKGLSGLRALLRFSAGMKTGWKMSDSTLHTDLRAAAGAVHEEYGVEILPEYQP